MAGALGTALLLHLSFPVGGPMPAWRALLAWVALVPLLVALVRLAGDEAGRMRPLQALLTGWLCGAVWFGLHCSWVYRTMHLYGGMGSGMAAVSLVLFSLFLGVWFGVFAGVWVLGGVALGRKGSGAGAMLAVAPVLWVAMEFAVARIPSFPWDELGYTQVDNGLLTRLAPWTGVMGISLLLAAANAVLAAGLLRVRSGGKWLAGWAAIAAMGVCGFWLHPNPPVATATAMLVQPNLNVATDDVWTDAQWQAHMTQFARLAAACETPYFSGMESGVDSRPMQKDADCASRRPDLIAWPESPAPFRDHDPRFRQAVSQLAQQMQAPVVVGDVGMDLSPGADGRMEDREYNSASVIAPSGAFVGRYDKVHLVPFGEYVPARELLFFAHQLTSQLSDLSRGMERRVFRLARTGGAAHRYGIFICYESIFGDEVREYAELGADVLVNLSDDGWYGDTDAPWQHLNMARMRAIENHRWLLLDTNNGLTAVVDPNGVVRQSIARNRAGVLVAHFGQDEDETWYTQHGDVVGMLCAILSVGFLLWSTRVLAGAALGRNPER